MLAPIYFLPYKLVCVRSSAGIAASSTDKDLAEVWIISRNLALRVLRKESILGHDLSFAVDGCQGVDIP
jgi:hypothetical protein